MQSFTRRRRGWPGAPLAIGFGLVTVRACGADRPAAIPAVTTATGPAAIPAVTTATCWAAIPAASANRSFHQVSSGVDGLVTANQVLAP